MSAMSLADSHDKSTGSRVASTALREQSVCAFKTLRCSRQLQEQTDSALIVLEGRQAVLSLRRNDCYTSTPLLLFALQNDDNLCGTYAVKLSN